MYPELTRLRLLGAALGRNMSTDRPYKIPAGTEGTVIISTPSVLDRQIVEFSIPGPQFPEDVSDITFAEADLHDSQVEVVSEKTA